MSPVIKLWLREPRRAWRNGGGPVPRGFRSKLKRVGIKRRTLVIDNPRQAVRRGHWVVRVGGAVYTFSPAEMRRLYSRVPL